MRCILQRNRFNSNGPFGTDVEIGELTYKANPKQYDTNSNFYYGVSWKSISVLMSQIQSLIMLFS